MLARLLVEPTIIIEGGLEVKLPTMCTDEKQRWEEPEKRRAREEKRREEKRRGEERRGEERESQKKPKMQVRER